MGKSTIIPFGPQHPVLPEPVHLDLEIQDEKVIRAIPSIGYVHRGLEKLTETKDYNEMIYVIERVCGICSFGHGWGYASAVEGLMDIQVPDRAEYLRTAFHELSRIHSHLLWLGLLADGFGFESLFMQCWRIREKVLDLFDKATGGRVIFAFCKVGGVRKDLTPEMQDQFIHTMKEIKKEVQEINKVFLEDISVKNRLEGVGYLSKEDAVELCAVGPVARASGVNNDIRMTGMGRYNELGFKPILDDGGDCYARCKVRTLELMQSISLVEAAMKTLPEGPIDIPVKGMPPAGKEFMIRVEQPRGEAYYYVKGNGTKHLQRVRVRTPTNANIPAMVKTLQGCDLTDVSMLILTIDPCISCTER